MILTSKSGGSTAARLMAHLSALSDVRSGTVWPLSFHFCPWIFISHCLYFLILDLSIALLCISNPTRHQMYALNEPSPERAEEYIYDFPLALSIFGTVRKTGSGAGQNRIISRPFQQPSLQSLQEGGRC